MSRPGAFHRVYEAYRTRRRHRMCKINCSGGCPECSPEDHVRNDVQVFLSRKNLQTLIEKLDAIKAGRSSKCTLIKMDTTHPVYPMTQTGEGWLGSVTVTALEDEEYYTDRQPGEVAKI